MQLTLGGREIQLIEANIHSDDATVIWLPDERILLAGDTLEDTVTYVGGAARISTAISDLERLWALDPAFILPNHGDPDIIAAGGYSKMLISGHAGLYQGTAARSLHDPAVRSLTSTRVSMAPQLEAGWISVFRASYEEIHRNNVAAVLAA